MKIGTIDKRVPLPDRAPPKNKKYDVDLVTMEQGDSFVMTAEPGQKLGNAVSYLRAMAKKQGVWIEVRAIDATRARVWKMGKYVAKGGTGAKIEDETKGEVDG